MSDKVTDKSNPANADPKSKGRSDDHADANAAAAAKAKLEAARVQAEKAEAAKKAQEKAHESMVAEALSAMRNLFEESKHAVQHALTPTQVAADKNNKTLVDAGNLPHVTVISDATKSKIIDTTHGAPATDASAVRLEQPPEKIKLYDKPLTPEEKYFTDFYQKRLVDPELLAKITPEPLPKPGQSTADANVEFQKSLAERSRAIQAEMGVPNDSDPNKSTETKFGPATEAAYKDYVNWLEKQEIPSQAKELQSAGKEPPPGSPIPVPIENGKPISLSDYQDRIATGKLTADLHINTDVPPVQDGAQRLENALLWQNKAKETNDQTRLERFDADTADTITQLGLPKGWQYQPGHDRAAWRVAASQMIELSEHVGRMANLVDKMKLPVEQPPGAKVTTGKHGTNISLDLPDNLRLDDPATAEKVRKLQEWETKVTPKLEAVRGQLDAVANDPKKALAWGDTVIPKVKDADGHEVSAQVQTDKDGKLINIVDPTKIHNQPGDKLQDANLLSERFTAKTDPKTGEIIVSQDVQAQKVPWYSYENMIYSNVGKPADLPEKRYKPDDLVAVNKGSGTEFMLAKDLESYERTSATMHYGEKALMATMDVAMVATGTIEVAAAVKGARLLVAAGEVAANVGARDVLKTGAKGVWDLTLGAGGITSSAELQSSTFGRELADARNTAFMATLGVGAIKPGMRAVRFLSRGTGDAKSFAEVGEEAARANKGNEPGIGDTKKSPLKPADAGYDNPPEVYKTGEGVVKSTVDSTGTTHDFEYSHKGELEKITVKSGAKLLTMQRTAGESDVWDVKHPDGTQTKLEGNIRTNADGSYTVSHTTDASASWYKDAYHAGPPDKPLEKSVTYHPDGSVTSKGVDAGFQPPEGSTYHKDARFGEYWTSPEGQRTWIDGEKRAWQEKSAGVWQSTDGVMTQNLEYVKKEAIKASVVTKQFDWVDTYNGKETHLVAKPGDYKVDEGNGKFYVIEKGVFDRTYKEAPGGNGEFIKKPIKARQLESDQEVDTRAGVKHAKAGDYLTYGPDGEKHVVEKAEFDRLYKATNTISGGPSEATKPFALPTATGPTEFAKDGSASFPYEHGKVTWSKDGDTVSIADSRSGKVDVFEGTHALAAGVRFSFNNGAEVRISNSGLRMIHTPDMGNGVFKGEDGSVLTDVGKKEANPLQSDKVAPLHQYSQSELKSLNGESTFKDDKGNIWKNVAGKWTNDKGSMTITDQGFHFKWKDGSSDWTDSNGQEWHRNANDPPKEWRTNEGATYSEGTWNYIKRTKDDPQVAAVLKGLQGAALASALHPQAANAQGLDQSAKVGDSPTVSVHAPAEAAAAEGLKGPISQKIESIAEKAMVYTTYPIIAEQLATVAAQGKQVTGQVLQSMGFQLNQMWAPASAHAAAAAAMDYDKGQQANLPETQKLGADDNIWHPGAPMQSDKAVADTIAEYKKSITQNIPEAWWGGNPSKNHVDQIFDKLAHAVSPAGTVAERESLKKELATNITLSSGEISLLDRINGSPITAQQAQDLMDPAKRSDFGNKSVAKVAAGLLADRDQNVVAASSVALLFMGSQDKNTDGKSIAKASVHIYPQLEAAPTSLLGERFVGSRNFELNLSADYLAGNLKNILAKTSNDSASIAYGDLLVKNGAIPPQEFGAILQNVLNNPKATTEDKMHALTDANGPRMGALIGGLIMQSAASAGGSSSAPANFGSSAQDFENTLKSTAQNDADATVRATSAAMVLALSRFKTDAADGARLLDQISALRSGSDKNSQASSIALANATKELVSNELAKTAPSDVQRSLDTAKAYTLLESHSTPVEKSEMESLISKTLVGALSHADATQSDAIAAELLPERLKQLSKTEPELAEIARKQIIAQLAVPGDYSEEQEKLMVGTLAKMPQLLNGAGIETRNQLYATAKNLIDNAAPTYSDLKAAAVNAIRDSAAFGSADTLRQLAQSNQSPEVRLSALKALESIKYPELLKVVSSRLGETAGANKSGGIETDPDLVAHLQDLQYRLKESEQTSHSNEQSSTDSARSNPILTNFQKSISERYPALNSFDAIKQKDWVSENFPLLVKDNFKVAVQKATEGHQGSWFGAADKAANKVDDERQAQFDQLVKTAGGDATDESTQQARRVLASVVAQNGGIVGHSESIPTGSYYMASGNGMAATEIPTEYVEKAHNWSAEAAVALAKTANVGYSGRDLTAGLIGSILSENPPPAVREALMRAWDLLAYSGNGVLVSRPVYDYVRRLPHS